jgi:hypothetical protein
LLAKRLSRQEKERAEVASCELRSNLKLGPSTTDTSGGIQQKVEVKDCPRPVPPFPFKRDDILSAYPVKVALLQKVWLYTEDLKVKDKNNKAAKKNKEKPSEISGESGDDADSGDDNSDGEPARADGSN